MPILETQLNARAADEGRSAFALDDFAPEEDPRAGFRLAELAVPARRALWRRRAIVHAVIQRWDDAHGFSRTSSAASSGNRSGLPSA